MTPEKLASRRAPRSARGMFSIAEEDAVFRAVAEDLRVRGPLALQELRDRYASRVNEPERRRAIEDLVSRIERSAPGDGADSLSVLAEFLYFAADQLTLAKYGLTFPAYNILDEYDVNKTGPWTPLPVSRSVTGRRWRLLGRSIEFPIGVGPCPLTANSRWIAFWAATGYNVITYKSVRTRKTPPHAVQPHWVLLRDVQQPFVPGDEPRYVRAEPDDWCVPGDPNVSSANSFGIPSEDPAVWQEDVQLALQALYPDQLLIVSVLGDLYEGDPQTPKRLAADFVHVARLAYDAGARIIELNLSCPNLLDRSGVQPPICVDVDLTAFIVRQVRSKLPGDAILVAKLSYLESSRLRKLLEKIGPSIRGVSAVNTYQLPVVRRDAANPDDASDTFPGRREAGVSGVAIRDHALTFAQELVRLRTELGLGIDIIAMGGVTSPESFAALKAVGVEAVQSVTGVFGNPFLATDIVSAFRENLEMLGPMSLGGPEGLASSRSETDVQALSRERVLRILDQRGRATAFDLAAAAGVRVGRTMKALDELVRSGEIEATAIRGDTYYTVASGVRA